MDALVRPKRNRAKSEKAQMNDAVERKAELLKSLHVASTAGIKRTRDSVLEEEEPSLSSDEGLKEKAQRTASRNMKQRTGQNTLPKKTLTRYRN